MAPHKKDAEPEVVEVVEDAETSAEADLAVTVVDPLDAEVANQHSADGGTHTPEVALDGVDNADHYLDPKTGDARYEADGSLVIGVRLVAEPDQTDVPAGYRRSITNPSEIVAL